MKKLYTGKTKDVLLDEENKIVNLFFKDDATGENGVFDPGSNTVGGSVAGKGKIGLTISKYFFELMEKNGIPTHYLGADIEKGLMQVRQLTVPKLEFVLRYFTAGSKDAGRKSTCGNDCGKAFKGKYSGNPGKFREGCGSNGKGCRRCEIVSGAV